MSKIPIDWKNRDCTASSSRRTKKNRRSAAWILCTVLSLSSLFINTASGARGPAEKARISRHRLNARVQSSRKKKLTEGTASDDVERRARMPRRFVRDRRRYDLFNRPGWTLMRFSMWLPRMPRESGISEGTRDLRVVHRWIYRVLPSCRYNTEASWFYKVFGRRVNFRFKCITL